MNNRILQYKDKINRYQKAMDILPKTVVTQQALSHKADSLN
jgi:hypothetical protein